MRYLTVIALLLAAGCSNMFMESKTEQTTKTQTSRLVAADFDLEYDPTILDQPYAPPMDIQIFDEVMRIPPNAKVKASFTSDRSRNQQAWYEYIGTVEMSRQMTGLLAAGALFMALGALLAYYGRWKLGAGVALFGLILITCGVAIDRYPWVFLVVMILVLVGIGYLAYEFVKSKQQSTTLKKIVERVESLKLIVPEEVKRAVTDPLAKDKEAKTIRKQVQNAKTT